MKKQKIKSLTLVPVGDHWVLAESEPGATPREFPGLDEAAAAIPAGVPLTVALRCTRMLVERFALPSSDASEIDAMARLQLEKTLPYPIEETNVEVRMVQPGETESIAVTRVARTGAIEDEFAVLSNRGIWPDRVILLGDIVSRSGRSSGTVVNVFRDGGHLVLLIAENGQQTFVQPVDISQDGTLDSQLAQFQFSAEMAGIPLSEAAVRVEEGLDNVVPLVQQAFGAQVERFKIEPPFTAEASSLAPAGWEQAKRSRSRKGQLRKQIAALAAVYVIAVIAVVVWLVVLRLRVDRVEQQVRAIQPELSKLTENTARWNTLSPALDYRRFPIETLLHLYESRPSQEVLITNYDQTPTDLAVRGEAPSLEEAYKFLDTLKTRENIPFSLKNNPPEPMANNKVQFVVSGGLL